MFRTTLIRALGPVCRRPACAEDLATALAPAARRHRAGVCCAVLALAGGPAYAGANFTVSGNSAAGLVTNATYSTLGGALNSLTVCGASGYSLQMPGAIAQITFEPVAINAGVPPNAAIVTVSIPATGLQTAPVTLGCGAIVPYLQTLFMSGSQGVALIRNSIHDSPFNPVAGNAASLMGQYVARDFDALFLPFATNALESDESAPLALAANDMSPTRTDAALGSSQGSGTGVFRPSTGLGADVADFAGGGQRAGSITLPFAATLRSDLDPRRQLSFLAPVTLTNVEGALAYAASLGVAARLPVTVPWALSVTARLGTTSSQDLGASANLASLALGSTYTFAGRSIDWTLANQLGYYHTLGRSLDGKSDDPHVGALVTRNGVLAALRVPQGVQTHYANADFFSRSDTELGLGAGSNRRADSQRSYFRAHVSYLFSAATKGISAGLGYWF